tara:strand:+ start:282 stop:425 length:144 start_codon:yes stop_codon:yes gene_type:complete
MTSLTMNEIKRVRRRAPYKLSPYLIYAGCVGVSLAIVGALSVLSLTV